MQSNELVIWIADLGSDPKRRDALRSGIELTKRAVEDLPLSSQNAHEELARAFAEAFYDGWIVCDYQAFPGDPEPPPKHAFAHRHLQRCENIRIARDAFPALPALRAELGGGESQEAAGDPERDVFICHAGEDKDTVARPLAEALRRHGRRVWFDEFELTIGDRLREKIDEGLAISRFGVVILSPAFLSKKAWTERELDGLTTREVSSKGTKVILPVWHEVNEADIAAYSAPLAGRFAARTARGLATVVAEIESVLDGSSENTSKADDAGSAEDVAFAPTALSSLSDGRSATDASEPIRTYDEAFKLLRERDEIGLAEVMRGERRRFAEGINAVVEKNRQSRPDEENLLAAYDGLHPLLECRLGGLLPVIAYDPGDFRRELRALLGFLESRPLVGGYTAWPELADWASWWLAYACGAFALSIESWEPLRELLDAAFTSQRDRQEYLLEPVRESVGQELGRLAMARVNDSNYLVSRWEELVYSLGESELLAERWPELVMGEDSLRSQLNDFDFLVTLRRGIDGRREPLAHWAMNYEGGVPLARRLRADADYRRAVAPALGVNADDLIERAAESLKRVRSPRWMESNAPEVLLGT